MTQTHTKHIALAEDFCSRATIPLTSGVALKVAHLIMVWNERVKARTILRHMNHSRREDIGRSWEDVQREAQKPFWRA